MKKHVEYTLRFDLIRFLERIVLLVLIFFAVRSCNQYKSQLDETTYLQEVLKDSLTTYKNEKGELVSTIKAFQTARTQDFIDLQTKDSVINILQRSVKYYKQYLKKQGSVTHISSETNIDTIIKTETVYVDKYPIYKSKFNLGNWVVGNITAKHDSTSIDLRFKSSYTVMIGQKKVGLFKYKQFAEVINHNPYSETKVLRTYQVTLPKQSRFSLGGYAGYGVMFNKNGIQSGYQVGAGLNYRFLQF